MQLIRVVAAARILSGQQFRRRLVSSTTLALLVSISAWFGSGVSEAGAVCPQPPLRQMPAGDAASDAAGLGQWFESVSIAGITDLAVSTDSVVLVDFDGDGRVDVLDVHGGQRKLRVLINQGCFNFTEVPFQIIGSAFTADDIGSGAAVANVVDFNGDGFLDVFLTRQRGLVANPSVGNSLLLSQGALDVFKDFAVQMGVANAQAYNRQSSIGDVNGDGYLDIAIGADNISNTSLGLPQQRLYVYQPHASGVFEDGVFASVGGTSVVPEFGAPFACDPDVDRAGPGIALRDLDDDGDLDLLQTYHMDMNWRGSWDDPCASGEYDYGIYVWRNLLAETGTFEFERVTGNGLADQGKMRYDSGLGYYTAVSHAPGLPHFNTADVDNDGLLDVIAIGPTDPEWHVQSDPIAGRLWHNDGGFMFSQMKLRQFDWLYGKWERFFKMDLPSTSAIQTAACQASDQFPLCLGLSTEAHHPRMADTGFGDFDNDGRIDFILVDRREVDSVPGDLRATYFRNRGRKGRFRPVRTIKSGIDGSGISVEIADLDGDGLLDLYFNTDPSNSYSAGGGLPPLPSHRSTDKVYWNAGSRKAHKNHWLRVRLSGIPDRLAVGAKISVRHPSGGPRKDGILPQVRYLFTNHSYKSGHGLEVHFGLKRYESVTLDVRLMDGSSTTTSAIGVDRFVDLDVTTGTVTTVGG